MSTALATLVGAIIGAAASIIVSLINNSKQNALMDYRLGQIEKKVDKHNNLVERMYRAEETDRVHEEKIKVINHKIENLERGRTA